MNKVAKSAVTSWRTTLFGILTLVAGLAPIWAPPSVTSKIQATAIVIAGGGLVAAKDSNVSGGQ